MRNLLLIVIDTLRPDHLGCYGYPRRTSPCLDSLAARSSLLESCWSASNFTAPAFTSLFTGAYPTRHGVFDFRSQAAASPIKAALDRAGVRTGAVVTFRFFGNLLRNVWGPIEAVTDTRTFDYSKEMPRAVTEGALEWLDKNGRSDPFCLFVHYGGPHVPYRLPDEYADLFDTVPVQEVDPDFPGAFFPQDRERLRGKTYKEGDVKRLFELIEAINRGRRRLEEPTRRWLIDKYDATIRYNDDMVARLLAGLAELGLSDQTVVAVLSDHGEEFLEHGQFSHGHIHLYEEVIRTVGLIHDPDRPDPLRRIQVPVSHVGILPTLLRLAGHGPLPPALERLDFSAALDGASIAEPAPVFCVGKSKVAIRKGDWKWIHPLPSPRLPRKQRWRLWLKMMLLREMNEELYDLQADPAERINQARNRSRLESLRPLLKDHLAESLRPGPSLGSPGPEKLDAAEKERIEKEMRDLGYM